MLTIGTVEWFELAGGMSMAGTTGKGVLDFSCILNHEASEVGLRQSPAKSESNVSFLRSCPSVIVKTTTEIKRANVSS